MAWQNERKEFSKIPFQFIEVDVNGTSTRFCDYDVSPMPSGFTGFPKLKDFSMSPAKIDISGGIGMRATASTKVIEFEDYTVYGTVINPARYWAAWKTKNRNYRYQRISHYDGYIVNDSFDIANFIQRDFVIESMAHGGDGVSFSLRDPLMLVNDSKAKVPIESRGYLSADITDAVTSFTLLPSGIADEEYPEADSGDSATWYYVIINDEIMQVTERLNASDTFTVSRAQRGTVAEAHSADDKVQLCYYANDTIANHVYSWFTDYAAIDTSYINKTGWDALSSAAFPNTYEVILTEPTGVRTATKEICESAPSYFYYDTRSNEIQFKPQQAPPISAQQINYQGNLLMGKTVTSDRYDLHLTTVVVFFDIRNPIKDLEEQSNYRQVYIREDTQSVTDNGGVRSYKFIYSRFINGSSKSAAVLAAALLGRRMAVPPIEISYELDPKDGDVWTGDSVSIMSDLILNDTTLQPEYRMFQVISANKNTSNQRLKYTALEHTYGDPVEGDEDVEDPNTRLVFIPGEQDQLKDPNTGLARSLRDYYDDTYDDIDAAYNVKIIVDTGAVCGSSDNSLYAIKTGAWPELTTPPLLINQGLIVGKGGDGADVNGTAGAGGPAILLENDIRLDNANIIGGGGGGGDYSQDANASVAGAGGAGYTSGISGNGTTVGGGVTLIALVQPEDGANQTGGDSGYISYVSGGEPKTVTGGNGGNLGTAGGGGSGGAAGAAIDLNGYTITYENTGTILGSVS